jgi:NAD(P)-dependent dehydrogenase (short-subunit alcohol dehydrogenase family)
MQTIESYLASLYRLDGSTALVTGGGGGLGLMITRALVCAGAEVYIRWRGFPGGHGKRS